MKWENLVNSYFDFFIRWNKLFVLSNETINRQFCHQVLKWLHKRVSGFDLKRPCREFCILTLLLHSHPFWLKSLCIENRSRRWSTFLLSWFFSLWLLFPRLKGVAKETFSVCFWNSEWCNADTEIDTRNATINGPYSGMCACVRRQWLHVSLSFKIKILNELFSKLYCRTLYITL